MHTNDLIPLGSSPLSGRFRNDLHITATSGEPIVVADTDLLFFGDYRKVGFDLILQDGENRLTIHDYFRQAKRPALLSRDGASLSEQVVEALALVEGGERYAQAGAPQPQLTSIGRVEVASGVTTAQRNGVTVTLLVGDLVCKGDVVQTDRGSSLGITFIDGTTFSLSASARMVLNDMVYQAGGAANASLMSLVQGSISFVAGQVAKTGDMRVETPVATMGIRGTAVTVDIDANSGQVRFAVMSERDGTGRFEVYKRGDPNVLLFTVADPGVAVVVSPAGPFEVTFAQVGKTAADLSAEQATVQALVQIFSVSQARGVIPTTASDATAPGVPPASAPGPSGPSGTGGSGSPAEVIQPRSPINPSGQDGATGGRQEGGVPPPGSSGTPGPGQPNLTRPPADADQGGFPSTPQSGVPPLAAATNPPNTIPTRISQTDGDTIVIPIASVPVTFAAEELPTTVQRVSVSEDGAIVAATVTQGVLSTTPAAPATNAAARVTLVRAVDGTTPSDIEVPENAADLAVASGRFGTLAIASDGRYAYAASRAAALGQGERDTDSFTYTVETDGALSVVTLTFDVVGTNDDPVVTGKATALATEDGPAVSLDPLSLAADPDRSAVLSVVVPADLPPGVSFDRATGRFVLDPRDAVFTSLAAGATTVVSVRYGVSDGFVTVPAEASWTVTGVNDAPRFITLSNTGLSENAAGATVGQLSAEDPDMGDTVAFVVSDPRFEVDGRVLRLRAGVSLDRETEATVTLAIAARDASAGEATRSFTLEVGNVNEAPNLAQAVARSGAEGQGPFTVDLLAGASDPDGPARLRIENVAVAGRESLPSGFTLSGAMLSVSADAPDFDALAEGEPLVFGFTYDVVDEAGARVRQSATVTIVGTNDAPRANALRRSIDEDTPVVGSASATDIEGDGLTFELLNGPSRGTLVFAPDGQFRYTPNADFSGEDTFRYRASDGALASEPATVTVTVLPKPDAPVAFAMRAGADEDTTLDATVRGTDPDGDALRFELIDGPSSGSLTFRADGTYSYTPSADFNGADTFTYRASDGTLASPPATVTIAVAAVNDVPRTLALSNASVRENEPGAAIGSVAVFDPDSGESFAFEVSDERFAVVAGELRLKPGVALDHQREPSVVLDLTVRDRAGAALTRSFTVAVIDGNDPPVAADLTVGTDEDTAINGLVASSDPNGDALTYALVTGPTRGRIAFAADGTYTYSPDADFNGLDRFTFTADDGAAMSGPATVTIAVAAVNDAPRGLVLANASVLENTPGAIVGGIVVSDPDSEESFRFRVLDDRFEVVSGELRLKSDATLDRERGEFITFDIEVADRAGAQVMQAVTVEVTNVNEAPSAADQAVETNEDTVVDGVLVATDVDRDGLTYSVVSGPANGTLDLAPTTGAFTYTPNANFNGQDSFVWRASDGMLSSADARATITVLGTSDAPVAVNDAGTGLEAGSGPGSNATGNVLLNDSDPDGDALAVDDVRRAGGMTPDGTGVGMAVAGLYGSLTLNADGSYSYAVNDGDLAVQALRPGQSLRDDFTYRLRSDVDVPPATARLLITIAGQNDTPVASPDAYEIGEDGTLDVLATGVLENDTDVDGPARSAELVGGQPANGTLALRADGSFTYTPNANFSGQDTFTYRANDGATVSNTTTVAIAVTPLNDVPRIAGTLAGEVKEDGLLTATGQFSSVDPDANGGPRWQVVGGTEVRPADYEFTLDTLTITGRDQANQTILLYQDRFDGSAPRADSSFAPSGGFPPDGANPSRYTFDYRKAANGQAVLDEEQGATGVGVGSSASFDSVASALRSSRVDDGRGLKRDKAFSVEAVFDLREPDDLQEAYGLRLTDRVVGASNANENNAGDDVVELVVRKSLDGLVRVQFRDVNFAADVVTTLGNITLAVQGGEDQIALRFIHEAGSGSVGAAFSYLDDGVVTRTFAFSPTGALFGSDTGITADDEVWTRAQTVAFAPATSNSFLTGRYGTFTVNQAGAWNYQHNNGAAVQALREGEAAVDSFQVVATDDVGAESAPATVDITVRGTNEAPRLAGAGDTIGYTENDAARAIAPSLTVSDRDGATIVGATVRLSGYVAGQDVLGFTDTDADGIAYAFDPGTGTLTLTGAATLAGYQEALRAVTYRNTSENPSTATRTVSLTVDDGSASDRTSNVVTAGVEVTTVDDRATLSAPRDVSALEDSSLAFTGSRRVTLSDPDAEFLSLNLSVSNGTLSVPFGSDTISGSYNGDTQTFSGRTLGISARAENIDFYLRNLVYQPDADFAGQDTLFLQGSDSVFASVAIDVTPVNDAPRAANDSASGNEDTVIVTGDVLANDRDVDSTLTAASLSAFSQGANGAVIYNNDATFSYTPRTDFVGGDSFTYTVSDGALTSTATVSVTVASASPPSNTAPTISTANRFERAAVATDGGEPNGSIQRSILSADGRHVAFLSGATNLVANDSNGERADLFVRDLVTGETRLVNVGLNGASTFGSFFNFAISETGRYVAFDSDIPNLVASDTNETYDVFMRDMQTGTTERVSLTASGLQSTSPSFEPSISPDGRFVGFRSDGSDFVGGDTNGSFDLFLRDRQANTMTRVSVGLTGNQATGPSFDPTLSGSSPGIPVVAFTGEASNLVPGDTNNRSDVFVRDLARSTTTRVSVANDGTQLTGSSQSSPSISADGQSVLFAVSGSDGIELFVRNLATATTTRATANATGGRGNGSLFSGGAVSGDGRMVAFDNTSSDLVANDPDTEADVFVRDLAAGTTTLVSGAPSGTLPDGRNYDPTPSLDGRFVGFLNVDSASNFRSFVAETRRGTGSVTDGAAGGLSKTTTGTLSFTDDNPADIHAVSVTTPSDNFGTLTATVSRESASGTEGLIAWIFATNAAKLRGLGAGQTHSDVFTVTLDDGQGGTAPQSVSITTRGVNDAPTAAADGNSGDPVVEASSRSGAGDATATGDILANDTDFDFGDTKAVVGVLAGSSAGPLSGGVGQIIVGTYGRLTLQGGGAYSYTLDNDDPDTEALTTNQQVSDLFTYTMADMAGATATSLLTIGISGAQDGLLQ